MSIARWSKRSGHFEMPSDSCVVLRALPNSPYESFFYQPKKQQRPLSGPLLSAARRRIPTAPANQVAGTWYVRKSYTTV